MTQTTVKPGYRPQSIDTSLETDVFIFSLLRQRSPQQRLEMGATLNRNARQFSINCFRQRFSALSHQEFANTLGHAWLQEFYPIGYVPAGNAMTWVQDSITLAAQLHPIFESLQIPYYITGGVAAIAYGEPRTTQDLDIVLLIRPNDIAALASHLEQAGFYVPGVANAMSGTLQTLQATHIESIARVDLMIALDSEFAPTNFEHSDFERTKFARRQRYEVPGGVEVYLATAEDVILSKIQWGLRSQSEKQWRDVTGILKTQAENLDYGYLAEWGDRLGILDSLSRALTEAGI